MSWCFQAGGYYYYGKSSLVGCVEHISKSMIPLAFNLYCMLYHSPWLGNISYSHYQMQISFSASPATTTSQRLPCVLHHQHPVLFLADRDFCAVEVYWGKRCYVYLEGYLQTQHGIEMHAVLWPGGIFAHHGKLISWNWRELIARGTEVNG